MALKDIKELKIFSLNRIKFQEMWDDAISYIKKTYSAANEEFTTASPFSLLLLVILHMGRMIFYYIEDSITGLNMRTAYRADQIKGLATLAGHDAARPIAARGAIQIVYKETGNTTYTGNVAYIPNKFQITSKLNGCDYTVLLGAETAKITMQPGNYVEATIIQGNIKVQSATSTGNALQSFNFAERNYTEVDQYYVNIYVNGEQWETVKSIIDLGYNQKGCVVRTGMNGGLDVFFGNTNMGMIPAEGATIICEYIVTDGLVANLEKDKVNSDEYWTIDGDATMTDGTTVSLDENFRIVCMTDVIFGTASEDTALTQLIAPHTSRAYVLATESNYRYFFKRMNMFSDIEIIQGTTKTLGVSVLQLAYDLANANYQDFQKQYNDAVSTYGETSDEAKEYYDIMMNALKIRTYAQQKLSDHSYKDNTIYLYLVPDITKRISSSQNYFSCDESLFYLSDDEQNNIINLINNSGQKIITVENRIIQPQIARFSVNVQAKVWEGYDEEKVYSAGLEAISNYLLNFNRKDIIPVSDIVSIFENNVEGIDSVKVWFDADVNNQNVYGEEQNYGLDDYGDIVLTRKITNNYGQVKTVRDILPLVRGGFTSPEGIEYSSEQSFENKSAYNFTVSGYSTNRRTNLNTYVAVN